MHLLLDISNELHLYRNWFSRDLVLAVCYYRVTYAFQSESVLYSCLNIKELFARNRRDIWSLSDSNMIRSHNHLVRKRTLNHLVKWLSVCLRTKWLWVRVLLLSLRSCFVFNRVYKFFVKQKLVFGLGVAERGVFWTKVKYNSFNPSRPNPGRREKLT